MKRNKLIYLLLLAFLFYEAMVFREITPAVMLSFAVLLGVLLWISAWLLAGKLHLTFDPGSADFEAGKPGRLRILAENRSILPMIRAEIRLEVQYAGEKTGKRQKETITLAAGEKTELVREFLFPYCGKVQILCPGYRVLDMLGLFGHRKRTDLQRELLVRPKPVFVALEAPRERPVIGEDGTLYHPNQSGYDNSEVYQIRDYQEGDRLTAVHWKLSARADELLVKEFSLPKKSSYLLLLDGRCRNQAEFHRRITALLSLSCSMTAEDCVHSAAWFDYRTGRPQEWMVQERTDYERLLTYLPSLDWSSDGEFPLALYERFYPQVRYVKVFYVTGRFDGREAELLEQYRGAVKKAMVLLDGSADDSAWRGLEILDVSGEDWEQKLEHLPVLLDR